MQEAAKKPILWAGEKFPNEFLTQTTKQWNKQSNS
jgi:hypothetical protein